MLEFDSLGFVRVGPSNSENNKEKNKVTVYPKIQFCHHLLVLMPFENCV